MKQVMPPQNHITSHNTPWLLHVFTVLINGDEKYFSRTNISAFQQKQDKMSTRNRKDLMKFTFREFS